MVNSSKHGFDGFVSDTNKQLRKIEAELKDQEIKLYPATKAGEHARSLWRQIRERLLRGAAVEITASALKLHWHREELRRARTILVEMELIKPRADGRYVARLGPFGRIDDVIRDQYLDLKMLEEVVIALYAIMGKPKPTEGGATDLNRKRRK